MRLSQFLQGFGPNNYIEEIEECEDNTYGVVVSSFVRCCVSVLLDGLKGLMARLF